MLVPRLVLGGCRRSAVNAVQPHAHGAHHQGSTAGLGTALTKGALLLLPWHRKNR